MTGLLCAGMLLGNLPITSLAAESESILSGQTTTEGGATVSFSADADAFGSEAESVTIAAADLSDAKSTAEQACEAGYRILDAAGVSIGFQDEAGKALTISEGAEVDVTVSFDSELDISKADGQSVSYSVIAESGDELETTEVSGSSASFTISEAGEYVLAAITADKSADDEDGIALAKQQQGPWDGSDHRPYGKTSVDHIDIGVDAKAKITYNGKVYTKDVKLQKADFNADSITIKATQNGSTITFQADWRNIRTSQDKQGRDQFGISGTYPVGTSENPVTYEFSLTKNVTFRTEDGDITIPVTFTSTFTYFDEDNCCPMIERHDGKVYDGSGMDFMLGEGGGAEYRVSIQKDVCDEEGNRLSVSGDDASFEFRIVNGNSAKSLSVKTESGLGYGSAEVEEGEVYIVETEPAKSVTVDDVEYTYVRTTIKAENSDPTEGLQSETVTDGGSFVVTNVYKPVEEETTSVSVQKKWIDSEDQDGKRPESVTVTLYADDVATEQTIVLNKDNDWKDEFKDLPVSKDGKDIVYTVKEETVEGYTPKITGSAAEGYLITNEHTPETTEVTVKKVWDDNDNQDGIRPESVTVRLYNGKNEVASRVITDADGWEYTFRDLPKYSGGKEITYKIKEDKVSGYSTKIEGTTITNKHTPEVTSVKIKKTWKDNKNAKGARPTSITVNLLKNGEVFKSQVVTGKSKKQTWEYEFKNLPKYEKGQKITYTISEDSVEDYTTEINGYNITNTYAPGKTSVTVTKVWDDCNNQDGIRAEKVTVKLYANGKDTGKTVVLNEGNNWTATFTDLDVKADKKEISYTVKETGVSDKYSCEITGDQKKGYTITNSHTPETVEVAGTKTWDDGNNQDGKRPTSITVKLLANGVQKESAKVTSDVDWSYRFENLPKYEKGTEIIYTVVEDAVEDYSASYEGYNIKNTHTPGKTSISVTKSWQDEGNKDGIRPESVTITLLADGKSTGKAVVLSEKNKWNAQFQDLDVCKDGKAITYTVSEERVKDYDEPIITGDAAHGFVVTNKHTPKGNTTPPSGGGETTPEESVPITNTTNVAVGKVWLDSNNQDGIRPASVTVQLYRNGEAYGNPVTLSDANEWWYRWDHLDASSSWTVDELNVAEGYTKTISKNAVNAWVITNAHTPETVVPAQTSDTTVTPAQTPARGAGTGDESHTMLWLVLMLASGAGVVTAVLVRRKLRRR